MATAMHTKVGSSSFTGRQSALRPQRLHAKVAVAPRPARRSVVTEAGYIGSATNLIMVASTTAFLVAGRFGVAPTATKNATAGLKLVPADPGLKTGDPAGFTAVDVLGLGALGHVVGVGTILGLRAVGAL